MTKYRIRIYSTIGGCREFNVSDYDRALSRIDFYRKNWEWFKFATLAVFVGYWLEIPLE